MTATEPIDVLSQGAVDTLTHPHIPDYRVVIRTADRWLSGTSGWWLSLQAIDYIPTRPITIWRSGDPNPPTIAAWVGSGLQTNDGIMRGPLWWARIRGRWLLLRARRA